MSKQERFEYLGDGLYVLERNGQIWLCTDPHDTIGQDAVCLEPDVLEAFLRWLTRQEYSAAAFTYEWRYK